MNNLNELKIVVCGPVDAGKSSLIGVLNNGILDNGRGYSRNFVLKHEHEKSTGRTSNITVNTYSYKLNDGIEIIKNKKVVKRLNKMDVNKNERIVNLIDLAGHEKYLKTTVYGMLAYYPNYGIVVIGANTGITKLTKEHLGIMLYLDIPFSIVITKIDIAPNKIYNNLVKRLEKLLYKVGKELYFINTDGNKLTKSFINENDYSKIPVISISNKTGINIDNLHYILNNIPVETNSLKNKTGIISIDANFQVPGIGLVVCGTNIGSIFSVKQKCYLGPVNGKFYSLTIRSIHNCLRENVSNTKSGGYYSLAIKFTNPKETLTRSQLKKGMVLLNSIDIVDSLVTTRFRANVKILHHSTMIKSGYCPLIHVGPIRQTAMITVLDNKYLHSGDNALLEFNFMYRPELVRLGQTLFFRDGSTKGVGKICELINE